MNKVFGILIILAGIALIALGVYTGIVGMLIGGIVDIINQIKAPTTDALAIAVAIVKIVFCELPIVIGFWTGMFTVVNGVNLCSCKSSPRSKCSRFKY